jgi:branched-chain amino acid transport system permease protein
VNRTRTALALGLGALALFPLAGAGFYTELLTKVMVLSIFAMSLDLLVGYTGLVSFGHAASFGIGAYVLGLGAPRYDPANLWLTLGAAVLVSGLAALAVGLFVVRVKGTYFIMVTLAFAQMFHFVFHDTELGGGSDGINVNFKPAATLAGWTPFDLGRPVHVYYSCGCCCARRWATPCGASAATSTGCAPWASRCCATSSPASSSPAPWAAWPATSRRCSTAS